MNRFYPPLGPEESQALCTAFERDHGYDEPGLAREAMRRAERFLWARQVAAKMLAEMPSAGLACPSCSRQAAPPRCAQCGAAVQEGRPS